MTDFAFRWLHLSDLHVGMYGQDHLWSHLRHHLYDDLPELFEIAGRPDLVIFSGDIVQKGHPDEFKRATEILLELWEQFKKLDATPTFFAVPGNHDLVRPPANAMAVKLLRMWSVDEGVREEFLGDSSSEYRNTVVQALENYRVWYESLSDAGIPVLDAIAGMLPGDLRGLSAANDRRVGIIGLNSTWLQLTGDAVSGDMHVDPLQLAEIETDAEGWARQNDFNLLVTHHPTSWLSPSSMPGWRSEIAPPGRFDLHLFGHMHEPFTSSASVSGSTAVHQFQSPSLFGMEKLKDGTTARLHGYSMGEFSIIDGNRQAKVWPRRLKTYDSGQMKILPDHDFNLTKEAFSISLPTKTVTAKPVLAPVGRSEPQPTAKGAVGLQAMSDEDREKDVLGRFRYHLPPAGAHAFVRKLEQEASRQALSTRGFWLVADWGMSGDDFLASVLSPTVRPGMIYRLDLGDVLQVDNLEEAIETRIGLTLPTLSVHLDAVGQATLILDEIVLGERQPGAAPYEAAIENLAQTLIDYCPGLTVIMRTRFDPVASHFSKVAIAALDEADVTGYIGHHADGGDDLTTQDVVAQLYSFTGGVPERLDRALKSLKVVTLSDLVSGGVDDVLALDGGAGQVALRRSFDELINAEDDALKRSLEMLKVLSTYPHGAEFQSIRRFNGARGFYDDNATELMQRAFVTASAMPGLNHTNRAETKKILQVPRPVRDFVRGQMSLEEIYRLNRRAADLSFGEDWRAGSTTWPSERKYSSPKCPSHEVANASEILIRLFRLAIDEADDEQISLLAGLGARFSDALIKGDHFYGASRFCTTFLQLAPHDVDGEIINRVRMNRARALRMTGNRAEAIELLQDLLATDSSKSRKEIILIDLALAYSSTNDPRATETANELLRITKNPHRKMQARSIIIDQDNTDPQRLTKLASLEKEARKKGATVVANNIALDLARSINDPIEGKKYLDTVVTGGREKGDFYNEIRAYIDIADRQLSQAGTLGNTELVRLIGAYQYLFNQRIPSLFDKCHRLLWQAFSIKGQVSNLLALFRHSSFIWRIRGAETNEQKYVKLFTGEGRDLAALPIGRDATYLKSRVQSLESSSSQLAGPADS